MGLLLSLIISAIVGLVVFVIGAFFDKTPNNQYAGLAGLLVFLLVFISSYQRIDL